MLRWTPCLTSIVIYHVLHSLAESPRGVCWEFLLWPTVKRLEWNGLSQVVWAVGEVGVSAVAGRFGPQCSRSTLSTVNHCHPSEATQLALHTANPFSSLFQLSVSQTQDLIKRLWSRDWGRLWREAGWQGREEKACCYYSASLSLSARWQHALGGARSGRKFRYESSWWWWARQPSVHPTLYPSIHPASFPPPPTHSHLPSSHHQCSQGDERHGEEGPQGINFSHGLESSSQKTWQPQTAWLKKKRREEERRGGEGGHRRRRRGGILHMMALREGFWILGVFFFPSSKAPMSWLRMSKLFVLFFHQSLCCPA